MQKFMQNSHYQKEIFVGISNGQPVYAKVNVVSEKLEEMREIG